MLPPSDRQPLPFDMESRPSSDPMDGRPADSGFGQDHFLVFGASGEELAGA